MGAGPAPGEVSHSRENKATRLDLGVRMAGLGLDWGGRGCPRIPLPFPPFQPPAQSLSLCSPGKAHQGDGGVGGPGNCKRRMTSNSDLVAIFHSFCSRCHAAGPHCAQLAGPESLEEALGSEQSLGLTPQHSKVGPTALL